MKSLTLTSVVLILLGAVLTIACAIACGFAPVFAIRRILPAAAAVLAYGYAGLLITLVCQHWVRTEDPDPIPV